MKENMNITDSLKSNKKPILVLCVLLIACAGYFYYHQSEAVQAAKAASELRLSGNVDVREISLAFRNSDRILEMFVEEGDSVKKGQILAKLDTEELSLKIQNTKSQIRAQ